MTGKYEENKAGILQLSAEKKFESYSLRLGLYRTHLYPGATLSHKILPVVVTLMEKKGHSRSSHIYSFDHNGILLSHGYSVYENDECIVDEAHDMSLDKLIEHGKEIEEMAGNVVVPVSFLMSKVIADIIYNKIDERNLPK